MLTIAIVNEKGGTGKTTTAVNLTAALGELGKQVVLVDLDGQAASSRWLGVEDDCRFADALWRGEGLELIRDILPNVALAPGSGKLDSVAHDLRPTQGGQLRKLLLGLRGFDFAIIDCPPSLGNRLIGNALLAASHAIVPVETSILAMDGLKILLTTLQDIEDGFGHHVQLAGVVACRYDARTKLSRLILDELKRALPDKVFQTVIRENVRLRECPGSGKSILTYAPDSHAAEDYLALAVECLGRLGQSDQISPQQFQAVSGLRDSVESLLRSSEPSADPIMPEPIVGAVAAECAAMPSADTPSESATVTLSQEPPVTSTTAEGGCATTTIPAEGLPAEASAKVGAVAVEFAATPSADVAGEPATVTPPAETDRFVELSPYATPQLASPNQPPFDLAEVPSAVTAASEPTPELADGGAREQRSAHPTDAGAVAAECAATSEPAETQSAESALTAEASAQADGSTGKEPDFPALREVLQKLVQEPPAKPPVRPSVRKDSPWRKVLRAVGVD